MKILAGVLVILLFSGASWAGDFTDNGNDTVTDNVTGLMWQKDDSEDKKWADALLYCEALDLGGETDWRLPNIKELESITDDKEFDPAIDTTVFNIISSLFTWSSTTSADRTDRAWTVDFFDGEITEVLKTQEWSVRCVRGGL